MIKQKYSKYYDERCISQHAFQRLSAYCKDIISTLCGESDAFFHMFNENQFNYEINNKSTCLFLFVHGLNGSPSCWRKYIEKIKYKYNNSEKSPTIITVNVPNKGNCKLDTAVCSIYKIVKNYISKFPNNPIYLFGFSNGTRIIFQIEYYLRYDHPQIQVHIISIAGVFKGTLIMNGYGATLFSFLYSEDTIREMSYKSKRSQILLEDIKQPLPLNVVRYYIFYYSLDDILVVPQSSAICDTCKENTRYFEVNSEGHNSLLNYVCDHVLNEVYCSMDF